jgi:aspartate/methionine/tyrosine aminotransferase
MQRLGTETAFEVLARARALEASGKHVIHLEIGEPDFDTPHNVVEAGIQALQNGATHYTSAAGITELRTAIAEDAGERRGLSFAAENVVVTPGAKPIMFFVMLALLDEGASVVYPDPGFPIYESMVDFIGARRIPIGFHIEGDRAVWDVDDLVNRVDSSTRLIILNSPSNPTGSVLSPNDLDRIAKVAVDLDAIVLADEIYSRILYDVTHDTIAIRPGMLERTVILDGFSKTYAMTGWRLGYGVMPAELAAPVTQLMINSNSCTAAFTQFAGVEALRGPQNSADEMVSEFRRRRDLIVEGLRQIPGVTCAMPDGAFYAFPNISGTGLTSRRAADLLLEEAGVAVLSGTAFGSNGEGYLRLSYANSYENIQLALERIEAAFSRVPATV